MTTTTTKNALERVLDTFEWSMQNGNGETRGEVDLEEDGVTLHLVVWVHDNDNPQELEVKPLDVTTVLDPDDRAFSDVDAARRRVRELIHWFLCHEADEQMFFDGERVFYPHDEDGATISV